YRDASGVRLANSARVGRLWLSGVGNPTGTAGNKRKERPVQRAPHRPDGAARGVVTEDGFHFQEVFEAVMPRLTAITRFLVTTEGCVVVQGCTVQVHHAGTNLASDVSSAVEVAGGYIAGQTVTGVVGDADGVGLILVTDDGQYRPEDFFTGDGHVRRHVAEDGRFDVVALIQTFRAAGTANHQIGAFLDPLGDQILDLAPLGLGRHRSD